MLKPRCAPHEKGVGGLSMEDAKLTEPKKKVVQRSIAEVGSLPINEDTNKAESYSS